MKNSKHPHNSKASKNHEYQMESQIQLHKKKGISNSKKNRYANVESRVKTPQDPKSSVLHGKESQKSRYDKLHNHNLANIEKSYSPNKLRKHIIDRKLISFTKKFTQSLQRKVIISWKVYTRNRNQFCMKIKDNARRNLLKKYFLSWKQRMIRLVLLTQKITNTRDMKIKSKIIFYWKIEIAIEKLRLCRNKKMLTGCLLQWHLVFRIAQDEKLLEKNKKSREDRANEILNDVLVDEEMQKCDIAATITQKDKCNDVSSKLKPESSFAARRQTYLFNSKNKPMMKRVTTISRLPLTERRNGGCLQKKEINGDMKKSDERENEEPEMVRIKRIQKNRIILREIQREKWRLAEMHYRICSVRITFTTWKKILNTLKIKNNKAQLYHNDFLKQSSIYSWKLFIKHMHNKRELEHNEKMKNAANYYNLHLMWKSLMIWWEFLIHRRKLKEGVRVYYLQYLARKSLRKWSGAHAVEVVRLWNLEKQGSTLAKRIMLRWVLNQWHNSVLTVKRKKTLEEKVSYKWIQVRKWLESSE